MSRFSRSLTVLLLGVVCYVPRAGYGDDEKPGTAKGAAANPESPATTAGVQFDADFSSASGASLTTTNGGDEQREGNLDGMYAAYASVPNGQSRPLTMRVTEDDTTNGPDEQPGVLRMQFVELPSQTQHSGFLMYGNREHDKMQLPGWTPGEVTMADLRRTFIEFKFRADNPHDLDSFGRMYEFRIEPENPDPYSRRADFGVLIATRRWRTFRRPISSATNLEAFLSAVNNENPPHFKLVWGQHNSIQSYSDGDSLLIDDLKIVIE